MQHSSTSVGALAAALAKAQAAIANPEKSLTATIVSPFPREGSRTFRYAPLSSGLDLIRKCLGQHEIATVQTTAIDRDSGLIKLTTTLLHASGEWVSSDWPVCPVSETASPHRLGAALTYARRYALFTLVGIAGEDDLDAPDLLPAAVDPSLTENKPPRPFQDAVGSVSAAQTVDAPWHAPGKPRRSERPQPPSLPPEASNNLRRQLVSELELLKSSEAVASWALQALPLKNRLPTADAQAVEVAFTARLSRIGELEAVAAKDRQANGDGGQSSQTESGEQTVTVISKPVRERDREHLKFVASQPCLVCGRTPSDAHHIKFAEQRAIGRKVSDKFTVPLCRLHHRELHRRGNEAAWWESQGIDPLGIAATLWGKKPVGAISPSDQPTTMTKKLNGRNFRPGAVPSRNSETKPIVFPEPE
jgi:hypothetical protein